MNSKVSFLSTICLLTLSSHVIADTPWYVKPIFGLNYLDGANGDTNQLGSTNGSAEIDLEAGFVAGLGFGRDINDNFSVELNWEYRTAESSVVLADNTVFPEGNYASNIFFINGIYNLDTIGTWKPYVGAGLGWVQELDIDLERNGVETSLSGENEFAPQLFVGANYKIKDEIDLGLELRYSRAGNVELTDEGSSNATFDPDYNPLTLQLGISYDL